MDAAEKKFADFLDLLIKRTIYPIHNSDIKESCTATLLLIFAAIDAISKITCNDTVYAQGSKARFKHYLSNDMGAGYGVFETQIYALRCDIVHTGINTKVTLSKKPNDTRHLEQRADGFWINTLLFLADFEKSIIEVKKKVYSKGDYYNNVQNRLSELVMIELDETNEQPEPSPGPRDTIFP